ncbi:MAG: hypothetical protein SPJ07_00960 [Bacilli bacterium]|nr:hypothetical protein [Bacilli bacterium]
MKNKKINVQKAIKMAYKENKRSSLVIYLILRFLVIICMILQILRGDLNNALLCLLSLILLFAPLFIQNKFEITLPNDLEIAIYLFIFSAEILGEIDNFFGIIPYWDIILHTINGFLATAVGFSLVDLLNKNSKNINLSPFYLCLVAFCFSMTIGVLWEFFEYGCDKFLNVDMQKDTVIQKISSVALNPDGENKAVVVDDIGKTIIYDTNGDVLQVIDNGYLDIGLNDTIEDLFVNFIGAIVFSCFAFFDLKHNRSNSFINRFVPTKGNNKLIKSI